MADHEIMLLEDEQTPLREGLRHPEKARPPIERLVELTFSRACGSRRLNRLYTEPGLAVTIGVPTVSWLEPLSTILERACPAGTAVVTITGKSRGVSREFSEEKAQATLGRGSSVIVAATIPCEQVPATFRSAADFSVNLAAPRLTDIRCVIRETTGAPCRGLRPQDIAGLDLVDFAFAIRVKASVGETVARLRRASLSKGVGHSDYGDAVPVEKLVGYGEAAEWAARVVSDIEAIRADDEDVVLESALIHGPPGTGKTALARSLAKSARVPLVATSAAAWFADSRGDLDGVIKRAITVIDDALARAPSILFIDELDAIPDRAHLSPRGADWWTPVITNLLLQVDRIRSSGRAVCLLAATNHVDRIDAALKRPGRFDRVIEVEIPTGEALAGIFRQHLGGDLTDEEIESAVTVVGEATGAQVVGWVQAARRRADEAGRSLEQKDLCAQLIPPDVRPPELRIGAAIHEAGHAVASLAMGFRVPLVSIRHSPAIAGVTTVRYPAGAPDRSDCDDRIVTLLAGRAADEIIGGGADAGAGSDLAEATRWMVLAHASVGLGEHLTSVGEVNERQHVTQMLRLDKALAALVERDLQRLMGRARDLVSAHRAAIEAVAEALIAATVLPEMKLLQLYAAHRPRAAQPEPSEQGCRPKACRH